jgi:hypothetical protein
MQGKSLERWRRDRRSYNAIWRKKKQIEYQFRAMMYFNIKFMLERLSEFKPEQNLFQK